MEKNIRKFNEYMKKYLAKSLFWFSATWIVFGTVFTAIEKLVMGESVFGFIILGTGLFFTLVSMVLKSFNLI